MFQVGNLNSKTWEGTRKNFFVAELGNKFGYRTVGSGFEVRILIRESNEGVEKGMRIGCK